MSPREDSGERWLLFDHPSGVSDVSAVKNTGEAAALVCAKHISSKSFSSSVDPHLNGKVFFQLIANTGGSPVDTGHFFVCEKTSLLFFWLLVRR